MTLSLILEELLNILLAGGIFARPDLIKASTKRDKISGRVDVSKDEQITWLSGN